MTANAGIAWPWLRRIELNFEGPAKRFVSTGKQDNARLTVRIQKSIQGMAAANIMIYNLDEDSRSMFQRDATKVEIRAGWETGVGPEPAQCFTGSLFTAMHTRAGPDIVTAIQAMSMIEDVARVEKRETWNAGWPVRDIVLVLANDLAKRGTIVVDPNRIVGINHVVGKKGWSHAGPAREALDHLGCEFAFSWTIIDGRFQALHDASSYGGTTTVEEPYVIDVNPVLTGPLQIATGLKVRCAFAPDLNPGRNITVQSRLSKFSGRPYRINSVVHALDCFANDFHSDVTAFLPPGEDGF